MRLFAIVTVLLLSISVESFAMDEIAKVEKQFKKVQTFSATFKQEFFDPATGERETSAGTLILKKPMKMVWNYAPPTNQKIISDGKTVYLYMPDEKQVTAEPIGDYVASGSPLLFFAGSTSLSSLFSIELANQPNKASITGEVLLTLTPKEKSLNINRIIIRVDRKEWQILGFSIYDWTGSKTEISFTDIMVNKKINDTSFIFTRPKGVEQVEIPKLNFGVE